MFSIGTNAKNHLNVFECLDSSRNSCTNPQVTLMLRSPNDRHARPTAGKRPSSAHPRPSV